MGKPVDLMLPTVVGGTAVGELTPYGEEMLYRMATEHVLWTRQVYRQVIQAGADRIEARGKLRVKR